MNNNNKIIKFLIDLDGFFIHTTASRGTRVKFLPKELGVTDLEEWKTNCYTFKLNMSFSQLSSTDKKTVAYLRKYHHGLVFRDYPEDLPRYSLYRIMKELIRECNNDGYYIAFKGGNVEKNLLKRLNFQRFIDLEEYNCPKFQLLLEDREIEELALQLLPPLKYRCDRHSTFCNSLVPYCSAYEPAHFGAWCIRNLSTHCIPNF